jgi:hypothetical protein
MHRIRAIRHAWWAGGAALSLGCGGGSSVPSAPEATTACVLQSGVSGDPTWTWDGVQWTETDPTTAPDSTASFATTIDKQVVLVTAGLVEVGTHVWEGTHWTTMQPAHVPDARGAFYLAALRD